MSEEQLRAIATNLRKPEGELGKQVGQKMNEGNRHMNLYAIEAVEPSSGDDILEVGMGNGYFVNEIFSTVNDIYYTGCDFSQTMIDEAHRINAPLVHEGKAKFILSDAAKLPFADHTFDKVFTVNTLYFWETPAVTLAELRRVLKPKGKLVIAIRPKSTMQHLPFVKYGFTMYTREDVVKILSGNGFTVSAYAEHSEPDQEIGGQQIKMGALIVKAISN
jgi:ubiquinone/menaquinone biosynthesis C-methylase UbiE